MLGRANHVMILAVFLCGILGSGEGKLVVWSPKSLLSSITGGEIRYTIANYGKVPYGKSIAGLLHKANPLDGCQPLDPLVAPTEGSARTLAPFVLVKRGDCDFVTMTRYSEMVGAKLVIVIDNKVENIDDVIMSDDGMGASLGIPTIMISGTDGEKLLTALDSEKKSDRLVSMTVKFELPQTTHVTYYLWTSAATPEGYTFSRRFENFHKLLGDQVTFIPSYVIWFCHSCRLNHFSDASNPNCLGGGRYCSPDPDAEEGPASGRDVVAEDLRQLCIWNVSSDLWWSYMSEFGSRCSEHFPRDCAHRIMEEVGIDTRAVDSCIEKSWNGADPLLGRNDRLRISRRYFRRMKIPFWPAIIINNVTYRGNMEDPEEVFDAICAAFTKPPEICELYYNPQRPEQHLFFVLGIALTILAIFLFLVIVVYKSCLLYTSPSPRDRQKSRMPSSA
eukprot:TRINITY_DN4135_c0_g1_i3.p1 TRINITY_DN4135_c0_g1~~TRINITY_DN4135_c0_g1_i3.p1  ORF type:complete len:447 (-),score=95.84 TRINITY_DN4135_c0_g1_i3:63-1403(-)